MDVKNEKIIEQIKTYLFISAYSIWLVLAILVNNTLFSGYFTEGMVKYIRLLVIFMILIKELIGLRLKSSDIWIMLLLFLFILSNLMTNTLMIGEVGLLIFSIRDIKFKKVIAMTLIIQVLIAVTTVIASKIGIIENRVFQDANRIRYGMGFSYATVLSIMYLYICAMYIYIRGDKMRLIESIFLLIGSVIIFDLTNTRNSFYLSVFLVVGSLLVKNKTFEDHLFKLPLSLSYSVLVVAACLLAIFYNPNNVIFRLLNNVFSGRLALGKIAINNYGIHILGQKITFYGASSSYNLLVKNEYNFIDSSYVQMLLVQGILFTVIFVAFYTIIFKKIVLSRDKYLVIIIMCMELQCFSDPQMLQLWYNPFLFLIGYIGVSKNMWGNQSKEL
ncbi:hypothetical protein ABC620_07790 [Latilactobacillus sakei]|uniref:hypothetical protein n=1 Tax=Latilactobacillus sakei TaxID=1599 RepID=UPI000B961D8F|nr:hypothetical protein [Latilactobacillus sakei]AST84056.1 hypothetical protein LBS_05710 [Latilactobacillus sakei]MDN4009523.1 hypothetical protein [Latilactobacillus sakei]SOB44100.1 membrane hypothetical protein [Latilactobacillus sakei]